MPPAAAPSWAEPRLVTVTVDGHDYPGHLVAWQRPAAPGRPWRALVTYSREVGLRHEHWLEQDAVRPR